MNLERARKILTALEPDEYRSSERLAKELALSSKTIRNEIKEINLQSRKTGAEIQTSPRKGLRLSVLDQDQFRQFINDSDMETPSTPRERISFLVSHFLQNGDWTKIETLSDQLYVSASCLSVDLKTVRSILESYNIRLVSRPGYGLRAEGSEFDMRLCLASQVIDNRNDLMEIKKGNRALLEQIGNVITRILQENQFQISSSSMQNLMIHLYIALSRMEISNQPVLDQAHREEIMAWPEYELAQEIAQALFAYTKKVFPTDEICYIAIHLASKKILDASSQSSSMMISPEIFELSNQMLLQIKEEYGVDFTNDFDLRMMLSLHMVPLDIRLQYDMVLHNPLLKDIKSRYPLAYNMAVTTSTIINQTYHTKLREDEVGYLALHFNLALERKRGGYEKKNIVIMCSTGRGTAQMLAYQFKSKFGKYLSSIQTTDIYSVQTLDFSKVDYVFSTLEKPVDVPVPVIEISSFLEEDRDLKTVRHVLNESSDTLMKSYFDRHLFFPQADLKNRHEVLEFLDREIRKYHSIPENFIDLIMQREKLAGTEFFNLIAMPHPVRPVSDKTFAAVVILKKPILWETQKVQFIFLMCMEKNMDRNLMDFYQLASRLLVEPDLIHAIIQSGKFETIMKTFARLEKEMREEEN